MRPLLEPLLESRKKGIQLEGRLRDQTKIDVAIGKGGICRDKSGLPPHQFDQTDPVSGAMGLHMGRVYGGPRFGNRGLKTERLIHIRYVIIDGLGYPDHADLEPAFADLFVDGLSAPQGAVSADRKQDTDIHSLQGVHHL